MHSVFIIVNGKNCNNEELRQAVSTMRQKDHNIAVRVTWENEDIARLITEATDSGYRRIVAAGGDGTLNAIISYVLQLSPGQRPEIALLPMGTANDFATSAGLPKSLLACLQLATSGQPVLIDAVCVNQQRYFINMATGGFGARITTETPARLKAIFGGFAYFLHGLLRLDRLQSDTVQIQSENFHWQGDAITIAIGNGSQAGGGHILCPDALLDDQLIELTIMTRQHLLTSLFRPCFHSVKKNNRIISKATSITLNTQHTIVFNLDGEPLKGTEFQFKLIARSLQFLLPTNSPLLSKNI